jgi:hypothetical protein
VRKLRLTLESLKVESFATAPGTRAPGTVRANLDAAAAAALPQGDTDCVATYGPCTCEPIETCSCGPTVPDTGDCR